MSCLEQILNSTSIEEFSGLASVFPCNLCYRREEAWVRNYHEFPIPNDCDPEFSKNFVSPDIVLIGDTPLEEDLETGYLFTGQTGSFMRGAIDAASEMVGIKPSCAFLNISMCRPGDKALTVKEASVCSQFVWKQLQLLRPSCIVTLGGIATRHILRLKHPVKISEWLGKKSTIKIEETDTETIPTVAAYHPSYLYRRMTNAAGILPANLEKHYLDVLSYAIKTSSRRNNE